jgi:hypothetical protein
MPPAVGTVQMAWRRHDVRAARRAARAAERAARRAVVTARTFAWISTQAAGARAVLAQLTERPTTGGNDTTADLELPVPVAEEPADV